MQWQHWQPKGEVPARARPAGQLRWAHELLRLRTAAGSKGFDIPDHIAAKYERIDGVPESLVRAAAHCDTEDEVHKHVTGIRTSAKSSGYASAR